MRRIKKTFTITPAACDLLEKLAAERGLSQSAVLETLIRKAAALVCEDKTGKEGVE